MKSITAANIKSLIKQKGMKQQFIAKMAGTDYQVFSNMLNGRKIITDVDVKNIAEALEVEPNELFKKN